MAYADGRPLNLCPHGTDPLICAICDKKPFQEKIDRLRKTLINIRDYEAKDGNGRTALGNWFDNAHNEIEKVEDLL